MLSLVKLIASIASLFNQRSAVLPYKHCEIFHWSYILLLGICALWKHGFLVPKLTSNIDEPYRKKLERLCNLENERKRRDRLYIIAEILNIAENGSLKTQIMYKANLSFAQLNGYLSFLTRMGLLKIHNEERRKVYRTTPKGEKYLDSYEEISNLLGNNEKKPVSANLTALRWNTTLLPADCNQISF